jgi:hypothetical protein
MALELPPRSVPDAETTAEVTHVPNVLPMGR